MTAAGYALWSKKLPAELATAPLLDAAGGVLAVLQNGAVVRFSPFGSLFSHPAPPDPEALQDDGDVATLSARELGFDINAIDTSDAINTIDDGNAVDNRANVNDRTSFNSANAADDDTSDNNKIVAEIPAAVASMVLEYKGSVSHAILRLYKDGRLEIIYNYNHGQTFAGTINFPSPPVAAAGGFLSGGAVDAASTAVLLQDGRVALISPEKKEILWISQTHIGGRELSARPSPQEAELLFDERGIFVLTRSGASAFALDGKRMWLVQLKGTASIPSFGDDGILYSGGNDWILNAYRLEDHIRGRQRSLNGTLPHGHYRTASPGPSLWASHFFRFEESELRARFREISWVVNNGAVGIAERHYKAWLMEVAGSQLKNPPWPRAPSSTLPDLRYRIQALRLLARIGSRETIPFLTAVFDSDPEFLVRAAAAETIGRIGVDPDSIAMEAFSRAIFPPHALKDEAALFAVAEAIGALCRFSGPPLSQTGIPMLTFLAGYSDVPRVQQQARAELRNLAR